MDHFPSVEVDQNPSVVDSFAALHAGHGEAALPFTLKSNSAATVGTVTARAWAYQEGKPRKACLPWCSTGGPGFRAVITGASCETKQTRRSRDECPAGRSASDSDHDGSASIARLTWAEWMLRVFKVDVLECPRCGGRLEIVATVTTPSAVKAILECLGLPARPPPVAAAREREQGAFEFDGGESSDG